MQVTLNRAEIAKANAAKETASTSNGQEKEQKETENDTEKEIKPKPKKKKKKKQILYSEDATKLFKKINDGKRLKNGITLSKACNIFSVAWELPEENGRILPSKVARHFKQVLPSKKTAKKAKAKKDKNIKPSVAKARTHRDNPTMTVTVEEEENVEEKNGQHINDMIKPQSMRGNVKPAWMGLYSQSTHTLAANLSHQPSRSSARIPVSAKALTAANTSSLTAGFFEPKKSIVTTLENLLEADVHRSNSNDNEKNEIKRERAGSMTDLHSMLGQDDGNHGSDEEDQVVESDIDALFKEVKKQKALEKKKQEKEEDAANAIDAALGL